MWNISEHTDTEQSWEQQLHLLSTYYLQVLLEEIVIYEVIQSSLNPLR